jgi:uncharacterized membrane protein YcaP (DUF421 family)
MAGMSLWPTDWGAVLAPQASLAELLVRGTLIYAFLFLAMRVAGRRLMGRFAMSDVVVMMLLAVAVREGLTGDHYGVADAAISGTTVLGWDVLIDRLAFLFPILRRPLRHDPVPIVRRGQLIVENARNQLLTREEIMGQLRRHGLTSLDQVREAYMEQDGSFTVVPK